MNFSEGLRRPEGEEKPIVPEEYRQIALTYNLHRETQRKARDIVGTKPLDLEAKIGQDYEDKTRKRFYEFLGAGTVKEELPEAILLPEEELLEIDEEFPLSPGWTIELDISRRTYYLPRTDERYYLTFINKKIPDKDKAYDPQDPKFFGFEKLRKLEKEKHSGSRPYFSDPLSTNPYIALNLEEIEIILQQAEASLIENGNRTLLKETKEAIQQLEENSLTEWRETVETYGKLTKERLINLVDALSEAYGGIYALPKVIESGSLMAYSADECGSGRYKYFLPREKKLITAFPDWGVLAVFLRGKPFDLKSVQEAPWLEWIYTVTLADKLAGLVPDEVRKNF